MSIAASELRNFLTVYRKEIRESAVGLLNEEMSALRSEDFDLYERNGNRLIYEAAYFPRRKLLAVLGMEAILEAEETGTVDEAVLRKLCDVLEKVCAEETWALPAHVTRQGNCAWRETVDLFASETAQTSAELLDRLGGFLPEHIRDMMEREINRRVLEPYFLSEPPYASWEVGSSNWAAVCAGSIGSACIHLNKVGKRLPKPLTDCLRRVRAVLPYYFQSFTDDGACMEGLQYYTYGMIYFTNFAWELKMLTGENLFERPDIATFPVKCFFKDGVSLSFSDGSANDTFRVGVQALQALMYGEAETFFPPMERAAHLHSDTCYRFAGLKLDWFATKEYLQRKSGAEKAGEEVRNISAAVKTKDWSAAEKAGKNLKQEHSFHILPSAQWCVGCAQDGTGFACKGGHNGESHNHNDIGHFIYEADGVLFLTDLGAGEYTKEYFSDGRYQVICNSSFGHSVPILNGQGQGAGAEYRCTAFSALVEENFGTDTQESTQEGVCKQMRKQASAQSGGRTTAQDKSAKIAQIRMGLGSAYSLSEDGTPLDGKAVRREIQFDLETGKMEVTDLFDFSGMETAAESGLNFEDGSRAADDFIVKDKPSDIHVTENLVTQILPVIDGNRICLEQHYANALIELEGLPGMPPVAVTVATHAHRNHQGAAEKVYGIRWEVPLREGKGFSRFTVRRIQT